MHQFGGLLDPEDLPVDTPIKSIPQIGQSQAHSDLTWGCNRAGPEFDSQKLPHRGLWFRIDSFRADGLISQPIVIPETNTIPK